MVAPELVAALDVGTTTVRCYIFDKKGSVRGKCKTNVQTYTPKQGYVEIRPHELWNACVHVINTAVKDTGLGFKAIKCLGISSQRNSFITWKRSTGAHYHDIITWKDLRANDIVNELNSSKKMKAFRIFSKVLFFITRSKRFLAGSILKLTNPQVTPRLLWVLRNIPQIAEDLKSDDVAFGTIDTWLLHKMSDGILHVTDISNASATGLFDPFSLSWAKWGFVMFKIPSQIFPSVVDNIGSHFGHVADSIFGAQLEIRSCMADQSASMFGLGCFNRGDVKITMGTGTFLDVNTGSKPHASFYGMYPLIAWRYDNKITYMAEGASNDTGILIQFAQDLGLINEPSECSRVAESVGTNDGVYFIPAFNGLQAPVNDATASAGLIGVKPTTRQPHLLRAILESIVFRLVQLFTILIDETGQTPQKIMLDGGVSNCDFIVQTLSDLIKIRVERASFTEMSSVGAAFGAGLAGGIWKTEEELRKIVKGNQDFYPQKNTSNENFKQWSSAVNRFLNWYP